MSDISIENLTISLGLGDEARKILDDVSFAVRAGESFGLVGESGSGKSTILRCIAAPVQRLDGPDQHRRQAGARDRAARPIAATCRWCSRTPTARCIRATRSARP